MSNARALIFANGLLPNMDSARKLVQPGDVLYAADGGANHILGLGFLPSLVVGDLDSLTEENLKKLIATGVRIVRYPQDKDLTDLELTINCALDEGHQRLVIVGALGGRLDMILSNLSLLTRPALLDIDVSLDDGVEQVFFVTKEVLISGKAGDIISLLPWGGIVEQVTTKGLRWELYNEDLNSYETRSISNEMRTCEAKICIGSGLLLCIHCRKDPSK